LGLGNPCAPVIVLEGPPHITRAVSHYGLPIYVKKYPNLTQKKSYGNSNISPCKKYINFKKSSKMKPKSFKILL